MLNTVNEFLNVCSGESRQRLIATRSGFAGARLLKICSVIYLCLCILNPTTTEAAAAMLLKQPYFEDLYFSNSNPEISRFMEISPPIFLPTFRRYNQFNYRPFRDDLDKRDFGEPRFSQKPSNSKRNNAELVNHIIKNFSDLGRLGDVGRK